MKKIILGILGMIMMSNLALGNDFSVKETKLQKGIISSKKEVKTIFIYNSEDLYEVSTRSGYLTTINLDKDEEIIYVGAGDTSRWGLETVETPFGYKVYIKPYFEDIKTNLIIETDRRQYNIILKSNSEVWNSIIEFRYPQQELKFKSKKEALEKAKIEKDEKETTFVNSDQLNFDYRMYKLSQKRNFAPETIFDDGNKTFFVMKKDITEMPALYVYENRELRLVNYRIKDNYYIVDRLSDKFIFKLGKKKVIIRKNK